MKLFGKKPAPLKCKMRDVIDLMDECIRIDAPILALQIDYKQGKHKIGISSDMNRRGQYFDTVFYYDDQEYPSIDQLIQANEISMDHMVLVIEDENMNDPRDNVLLSKRELA